MISYKGNNLGTIIWSLILYHVCLVLYASMKQSMHMKLIHVQRICNLCCVLFRSGLNGGKHWGLDYGTEG